MEQEIPDKQPGEALREMLARSQQISGQVPPVMQQPIPFVPPPKKVLSAKGKRERKNYFTAARYLGIAGVIMLLSPFIYAALLSGYHGNNEDGLAWEIFFMFMTFFPIGLVLSAVALIMFDFGKNLCK